MAEEDSLNVATFKTDDATSFNTEKTLREHLFGKVNQRVDAERQLLIRILNLEAVRSRPVLLQMRYILSVISQADGSGQQVNWEMAGAYLYELHLIPDFGLSDANYAMQIARNDVCTKILLDGEKTLSANLDRLAENQGMVDEVLRRDLNIYMADRNTLNVLEWQPPICHDEKIRNKLSFDCWKFSAVTTGIKLELKPLQDPKKPEKVAKGLILQNGNLINDGKKPVQISWTVTPANPPEIGSYRVTVIRKSTDGSESDVISPQVVPVKRKSFMVPMADNNLEADEKCIVRVRIQALTKGGTPISDAVDETEEFWVQNGEEITDGDPPAERGKRIRHIQEHFFLATYKTGKVFEVRSQGWDAKRSHIYSIRLSNNDRGDLILNPLLLEVERFILANANNLGALEVHAVNRRRADLADFKPVSLSAAVNQFADNFYHARAALFSVIRDQDQGNGVIAITNLHDHHDLIMAYIESYLELLGKLELKIKDASGPGGINTTLHDYAALLRIDTILLTIGPDTEPMEVVLLAPTHPLRILWLYQYETFVNRWIDRMKGKPPAVIEQLLDVNSLDKLMNLNIPNCLAWNQGRVFINTDNVDLLWSIFPSAAVNDLRTSVNATLQLLGAIGSRQAIISTVTPKQIADKIERYLCHHPYVRTLKMNVINPGDGLLLLEAIKQILNRDTYSGLNFDVKFFSPAGTRPQLVGNAFDDLMEQRDDEEWVSGRTLSEVEERLLRPNENPLFPKLIYAKHAIQELLQNGEGRFDAHLSFIIDYFGTTVATRTHDSQIGSSSLYNLLAEYVTDYVRGNLTATWSRMIAPNQCPALATDGNTERLYKDHDLLAHLASCFFDWGKSLDKYSTVQLELTDAGGKNHLKMLRTVHEISDWVFTIDRNFGIEYYDDPVKGPGAGEAGGYLIDYTPEFLDAVSHRLIISTHHQREIESILRSGFAKLLNPEQEEDTGTISTFTVASVLKVLKSVSGKLALKLINNPNQAQEVIGLALTRLALEKQGRLKGKVLIPVDSHINLFYQTSKDLENSELSLKRTDLMLVELAGQKIHVDLIEVKNRAYTSPAAQIELQNAIQEKNKNSEAHFRANFLGTDQNNRFDSEIKNKELANILTFYFERAKRYGLFAGTELAPKSADDAISKEAFSKGLEAIIAGSCDVTFGHEGFIINGSASYGIEKSVVHENDIYRIGRQGIQELLDLIIEGGDTGAGDTNGGSEELSTPTPGEEPPSPTKEEETTSSTDQSVSGEAATPAKQEEAKETPYEKPIEIFAPPTAAVANIEDAAKTNQEGKAEAAQDISIFLGKNVATGKDEFWNPQTLIPRKLTNQHLLVVGKSGSGKSETTKALIFELIRQGVPSIIFDYQGEYAHGDFYDRVKPQVFNVMNGLPINPFELPIDPHSGKKIRPVEMMFRLADTLNTVFKGSGDIQLGILREAIEECYIQQGFDMHDATTWDNQPPTLEMLAAVLEHLAEDRGAQVRNVQVRLQPLFKSGMFRQDDISFSFNDLSLFN
ncbi:MAG: DUF87 domain-containing protein, partial [Chloroflexi bacterium]|nr:DUF87 domain-containing protein [Chloroflexota bacterium]